jgi:thioredoxin-like negative regulator of GroEL
MSINEANTISRVFEKSEPALMFFSKDFEDDNFEFSNFQKLAESYRGRLAFVTVDLQSQNGKKFAKYEDVNGWPQVVGFKGNTEHSDKFFMKGELEYKNLKSFLEKFLEGKLEKKMKSELEPTDNDKRAVKIVVRDNWAQLIENRKGYVLLKIYAPWCGHSQRVRQFLTF